jgi:hypothetical protein
LERAMAAAVAVRISAGSKPRRGRRGRAAAAGLLDIGERDCAILAGASDDGRIEAALGRPLAGGGGQADLRPTPRCKLRNLDRRLRGGGRDLGRHRGRIHRRGPR